MFSSVSYALIAFPLLSSGSTAGALAADAFTRRNLSFRRQILSLPLFASGLIVVTFIIIVRTIVDLIVAFIVVLIVVLVLILVLVLAFLPPEDSAVAPVSPRELS